MHAPKLKTLQFFLLTLVQIALVGSLDHLTGFELGFFVFYFIPIAYAAWHLGATAAALFSLLCAVIWYAADVVSGHLYSVALLGVWNGLVRLTAFLLLAFATHKVKTLLSRERELTNQLRETLDQVKELRGLLPICASCKKIRNDAGYWEQMESYISKHSRAEFSHSICPECARQLYPEIFAQQQSNSRESSDSAPPNKEKPDKPSSP